MKYLLERVRKTAEALAAQIYVENSPVSGIRIQEGICALPAEADASPDAWQPFGRQDSWGGFEAHAWFQFSIEIPVSLTGRPVCLLLGAGPIIWNGWDATNPQFLVYVNGVARQGVDANHREVLLTESAAAGTIYRIDLQAYGGRAVAKDEQLRLSVDIAAIDRNVEALYWDLHVSSQTLALLSDELPASHAMLEALNGAVNRLDWRNSQSEAFQESVQKAREYLKNEFFDKLCGRSEIVATTVGHTHIDVAWLWTVAQTREKVARSFSTVLALMDQYPEYVFMSSQPQLYAMLKQDHPEIYQRVKARISEGRWEAEGGMWLEADCNVPSGESLVRQLLYGKAFFHDEVDVENHILWLPDAFGYSAALPQILKKSGIDYFMTTKISWNQFNKLPYDTFRWQGIDGSEVLTYFITNTSTPEKNFTTYNGDTDPASVLGTWKRYQQKNINRDVLISFGHGDGGGGPTRGMLETARRLSKGMPGMPTVRMGTARDFFERLQQRVADNPRLPKWVGELYLEYHRGTYTSMAANKRYNRKNEILWGEVEFLSVLSGLLGEVWPKERVDAAWKTILLNQFHDILPGSSIREVYEVCREEYEQLLAEGNSLTAMALNRLSEQVRTKTRQLLVVNTLGFARADLLTFPVPEGMTRPVVLTQAGWCEGQLVQDGDVQSALFSLPEIPAKGYATFPLADAACLEEGLSLVKEDTTAGMLTVSSQLLETRFFRITLDKKGEFVSVYDKQVEREVLASGEKGNALLAFEDRPMQYDNWDIDMFYTEKCWPVDDLASATVLENGPVRGTLRLVRRFAESIITQDIRIYRDIPRVDFKTHVEWQQSQILLKVAFPVDIRTERATYEIQFGHVERPTHWNTSWDWARFEVCGHRWADLSESGYGVSLLNDCKYGHDIREGVMRLTLIKSGIEPNPTTDRGSHDFTYSLYPHAGDWRAAKTLPMAARLNVPLRGVAVDPLGAGTGNEDAATLQRVSFVTCDATHVVVDTIKQAEDGQGVILRLYESEKRRGPVMLTFSNLVAEAQSCNLMELDEMALPVDGHAVRLTIRPLEILTVRIRFA